MRRIMDRGPGGNRTGQYMGWGVGAGIALGIGIGIAIGAGIGGVFLARGGEDD